jgi:hypothetical protein
MRLFHQLFCLLLIPVLVACQDDDQVPNQEQTWENHVPFELDYSVPFGLNGTDIFASQAVARGESDLIEASGIVVSIANPGHIWSHQDKSNTNEIFLLDVETGETVASYELVGVFNRDWEDIEIGPGPVDGVNYIYVAETGDNDRVYNGYKIYRFEEPVFVESHRNQRNPITTEIASIDFRYPNNLKHDTETLLLDPWTKDLFLVTKRDFFSIIYVLPYPQNTEQTMRPIRVGEFSFTRAVGGNISLDGKEMLIKTYDHIMYWERNAQENMVDMFMKTPKLAPYNPTEPQGEAICFDDNGGYYTLSEFANSIVPVLYYYESLR